MAICNECERYTKLGMFTVKRYSEDERPIIKGNGFDGLEIGRDRKDAEKFIEFINGLITDCRNNQSETRGAFQKCAIKR